MTIEQSYIDVPKPPTNETMRWVSLTNFENPEVTSVANFVGEDHAQDRLKRTGAVLTARVLQMRDQVPDDARPAPNIAATTSFVKDVGMQPNGNLYMVDDIPFSVKTDTLGVTSPMRRQSYIAANNIAATQPSPKLPPISSTLMAEYASVSQLTHLSGIPETGYFILDQNKPSRVADMRFSAPAFRHPTNMRRGGYFEEGAATLAAHMYMWNAYPGIRDEQGTDTRASTLNQIEIPLRHAFTGNHQACMAWGMEQLVTMEPTIWDIFIESRQRGVHAEETLRKLRAAVDKIDPKLYSTIEQANDSDPAATIAVTALINRIYHEKSWS